MERRFPPPWSVEELDACFVVLDHNGQQLAYVYYETLNCSPKTRRVPEKINWKFFIGYA